MCKPYTYSSHVHFFAVYDATMDNGAIFLCFLALVGINVASAIIATVLIFIVVKFLLSYIIHSQLLTIAY